MQLNINLLLALILLLTFLSLYLLIRIVINKYSHMDESLARNHKRMSLVMNLANGSSVDSIEHFKEMRSIKDNLIVDSLQPNFDPKALKRMVARERKKLTARSLTRRKEASTYLGMIASEEARTALEQALQIEKDWSVKVYISNALTDIHNKNSLPVMIETLINSHRWYREKAISNILDFDDMFQGHFLRLQDSSEIEIIELLIKYAGVHFNNDTKQFLFDFVDGYEATLTRLSDYYQAKNRNTTSNYKASYLKSDMNDLLKRACRTLSDFYYLDFDGEAYYTHPNKTIQQNAFWALSKSNSTNHFTLLMSHLVDDQHEKTLLSVLTRMISSNHRFLYLLEDAFEREQDPLVRGRMAQVLSNKIEYYILKLTTNHGTRSESILKGILANGKVNELIGFMNVNKDLEIENRLVQILVENLDPKSDLTKELRTYLSPRIVSKMNLSVYQEAPPEKKHARDKKLVRVILGFSLITLLTFPVVFFLLNKQMWAAGAYRPMLEKYVIDFNYGLAFYSIAINLVYLGLLAFSYKNVKKQARLWNVKNISMMFRKKMVPSISIVAPAFNEEKTIIASAQSLLNLNYPDYELIIVNDGSKDQTLNKLIEAFSLVRVDYQYTPSLDTAPIRGIYRNPSLPRMIVVDKSNGGKADSLNAGINVANKTYFCGIDADSLLEPDALLKLASLTLDESLETPALGGNIFPINGCRVDQGLITKIQLPKTHLAKFQTIEYMRAFMAGRLGWQQLNSLLIISGAFGLFRKDRIIGIGGYLTKKGQYKKDTVGEDMELVVRISRMLHEAKRPFKVLYAFNANCWTEVPEDFKSLRTQRFRWHRGLIDILYFHKKMLFNKKYAMTGLVAMPYFFIFEAIGPMIEMQGYLMVVLAAVLGILNKNIALLLFISTVFMGVIVSLSSLLIAERESHYFRLRDLLLLVGYAVIENFGPRQLFSFWRVLGQFSIVFGKGGWGQIKRKGVSQ